MAELKGKIAVVTGGSEGIGYGIARALVDAGAKVYITGRRQVELADAAARLGPDAVGVRADCANLTDLEALFDHIGSEVGRVDVMVANAGVAENEPLGAITEGSLDRLLAVNVKGMVFSVQGAVALMPRGGSVILLSSMLAFKGMAGSSIYSATKAAVRSLARTWAADLQARGIRVNVVSPGFVDTPGVRRTLGEPEASATIIEQIGATIPVARVGTIEDVGVAVRYLASDAAGFLNGADLQIDGGAGQI